MICKVEGCTATNVTGRGMCNMHYRRTLKGAPLDAPPNSTQGHPPKPWTKRALQVLADGEWHDYTRLVVAMTRVIPPNAAVAHMKTYSSTVLKKRAANEAQGRTRLARRRVLTQEQMLRSARRDMAWRRLYDLWSKGRIEIDPPPTRGKGDEHYSAIQNRKVRLRRESAEVDAGDG